MRFRLAIALTGALVLTAGPAARSADPPPLTPVQKDMAAHLDVIRTDLVAIHQDIWNFAELGLEEHRSAARLIGVLKKAGFKVTEGVSGMPTAFVAEYGSGKPVIGILAEYDALPELSQQAAGERLPVAGRTTGHGCGHSALGTAAVGAALAVKEVYEKHNLKGTIRVYGTPAEETLIGKVYMTLDGRFRDLNACLHWHPGPRNRTLYGGSKALISAKFTFSGLAAHASGSPDRGRSALDGVELMNVGANYMREHLPGDTRIHYVTTNGGQQPNVVPSAAQVWYYVRANTHEDCAKAFDWLTEVADAAAKMTRTKVAVRIETDCHEVIPNLPLSRVIHRNMQKVGPPKFDAADVRLGEQLQAPLRSTFGLKEAKALNDTIEDLPEKPTLAEGGSTDVGDVSWHVPTGGFGTVCFAAGSPGHSWQNTAAVGSAIGHKGMLAAAKVMALSAVDLLQDAQALQGAKTDFDQRMKGRKYTTRVPPGQKAPKSIR